MCHIYYIYIHINVLYILPGMMVIPQLQRLRQKMLLGKVAIDGKYYYYLYCALTYSSYINCWCLNAGILCIISIISIVCILDNFCFILLFIMCD